MKTFFYMGRNPRNKSGVSWKIWRIDRQGKRVSTWWGSATLVRRKVVPKGTLQTKSWVFRSEALAKEDEEKRIRRKLKGRTGRGYEKHPRRRS